MVVFDGFGAPVPARKVTRQSAALRALTVVSATYLIVQTFAICAAGLFVAGAILIGAPPWLVDGVIALIGAGSAGLAVIVARQAWAVEAGLARGPDGGAVSPDPGSLRPRSP